MKNDINNNENSNSNSNYLYGLNFLRVLAIIMIVIYHIDPSFLPGGFIGVNLFFIISSYLVTSSLLENKDLYTREGLLNSIKHRLKRILPPIITLISLIYIYMLLFNKDLFKICYSDGLFGAGLLGNWWFIFKKVDYFDSFAKSPFNHLWYLGVQEQALLIIGIIIFILNKKLSNT